MRLTLLLSTSFAMLTLTAHTQIKVKVNPSIVVIHSGPESDGFDVELQIVNNTDDTLIIPPANSNLNHVLMKRGKESQYKLLESLAIDEMIPAQPRQTLLPRQTGKVHLRVEPTLFYKKGKTKVIFYPIIKDKNGKELGDFPSNTLIVKGI